MILSVRNISKRFGQTMALDNVSFDVNNGQIAALLGENGAGKSTLLRLISGYYEADSGEIKLYDETLRKNRSAYLHSLGYVPEISALYGEMSVFDFLMFVARIRRLEAATINKKIKRMVRLLELQPVINQKNEHLSKGYKKRVELAAALLSEPELLLLDEPTEGLDPNQKQILRDIIKHYALEHTVIISTHTLEDVEALASQILLLHKGRLLLNTDLDDFKQTADNDLLQSFKQMTKD
jgi:ABC-2 type transport system ATP-binding protein